MGGICSSNNREISESQIEFFNSIKELSMLIESNKYIYETNKTYQASLYTVKETTTNANNTNTNTNKEINSSEIKRKINTESSSSSQKCFKEASLSFKIQLKTENLVRENTDKPSIIYKIIEKKGKGSFGVVYLVENIIISSERAMKKVKFNIKKDDLENNKEAERSKIEVKNELDILKKLNHPNILKVYDFYNETTSMYLVTEFCELGEVYKKDNKLVSFQAAVVMFQLFQAVNYFHNKGIIHRDLKPENILIKRKDESGLFDIRVIDFGVAFDYNNKKNSNNEKMSVAGSLNYMAPEVFTGHYSYECDLWSCGVIMYQILTGKLPFDGENEKETINSIKLGKYNKAQLSGLDSNEKKLIDMLLTVKIKNRISISKALEHSWFKAFNLHKVFYEISNTDFFKLLTNMIMFCYNVLIGNYSRLFIHTLLYITYNLPTENSDISSVFKFFKQIDINNKSQIDLNTFLKFFNNQMTGIESHIDIPVDLQKLFQCCFNILDFNGDKLITYNALLVSCINPKKILNDKFINLAFDYYDVDKKGKVSQLNLIQAFDSDFNLNSLMKSIDKKNDSAIFISDTDLKEVLNVKNNNSFISLTKEAFSKLIYSNISNTRSPNPFYNCNTNHNNNTK